MLEAMEGMFYLQVLTKVLLRTDCALSTKVLEGMLCVLGLLESVRRILKAVEHCTVATFR